MAGYEYTVVPAPAKGVKAKGVKTPEARFALALQELMNEMGAEGWEYQRAETLPSLERTGLTGTTSNWRHVLVFRRALQEQVSIAPQSTETEEFPESDQDEQHPAGQPGATQMLQDDGVEELSEVSGVTASLTALAEKRKTADSSDV